jgi:hypothetical protein
MSPSRLLAAAVLAIGPTAIHAAGTDLYSPALPAAPDQTFECSIVNVSASTIDVQITSFMSTGAVAAGPYTQTLAPGEAGGFAVPGWYAGMYCKFSLKGGVASDVRASITLVEPSGTSSFRVFNALSAY